MCEKDISLYLEELQLIRRASPHTVRNYGRDLGLFMTWWEGSLHKKWPIERVDARSFVAFLLDRNLSKTSVARTLSAINSFFKWMVLKEKIGASPFAHFRFGRKKMHLPKAISAEEVEMLFASVDIGSYLGLRDRAILELFYSSGLRVSELVALDRSDLDMRSFKIVVMGKGSKERVVPITSRAFSWVERYLQSQERHMHTEDHLPQKDGRALFLNHVGERITTRSVARILKSCVERAGLVKKITPHTLRHSIATHLLERGMDIKIIQRLLGHATPSTTAIYAKVGDALRQHAYLQAHPLALKKIRADQSESKKEGSESGGVEVEKEKEGT